MKERRCRPSSSRSGVRVFSEIVFRVETAPFARLVTGSQRGHRYSVSQPLCLMKMSSKYWQKEAERAHAIKLRPNMLNNLGVLPMVETGSGEFGGASLSYQAFCRESDRLSWASRSRMASASMETAAA